MLNLQKYLKKAEIDPGFKEKLLKDANQAIKEEFGEKIPYRLKCKKKLSFEVETDLSEDALRGVAGGNDPDSDLIIIDLTTQDEPPVAKPSDVCIIKGKTVLKNPRKKRMNGGSASVPQTSQQPSNNGVLSSDALSSIAGGNGGEPSKETAPASTSNVETIDIFPSIAPAPSTKLGGHMGRPPKKNLRYYWVNGKRQEIPNFPQ